MVKVDYGVVSLPKKKGDLNGDAYLAILERDYAFFAVIDGLGSGADAYRSAKKVISFFNGHTHLNVKDLFLSCHLNVKGERGAAASVLRLNLASGAFEYIGIGNVEGYIWGDRSLSLVNNNGTLGRAIPHSLYVNNGMVRSGNYIYMFSDGISRDFIIQNNPLHQEPWEMAQKIEKDYMKDDDRTILIIKIV
ncbi:Stage II sporulation protein E (SpoIIE) [Sporotomaculum syntrophicum]|uniref:Stage II sporulation protein E (SpoIIE) n=1 Tax=Sporotomaculum syntrophicum TaxID=182264 RepID=A0A9D3AYZ1_9FIRM|nr:hypothetical protein [Sporotomaculum syntrophicum]KAF1086562.1 Stage II sporulation protein E (SpoIIE) [Sporotomaculum syntrophicum]